MTRANGAALEYLNYTYDADGRRIGKHYEDILYFIPEGGISYTTVRFPVDTKYFYLGDTLSHVTMEGYRSVNDTEIEVNVDMRFTYDAVGPLSVNYNGTEYFYLKNAQGDVTGIVNAAGAQVVAYTYDAWGKLLSTTGSMAGTLGEYNPLRYRGYVYDTETGLYYLNSRYYNPETGRFINADNLFDTSELAGGNLFAYCVNNPVNYQDPVGHSLAAIVGTFLADYVINAVVAAIATAIIAAVVNNPSVKEAVNNVVDSVGKVYTKAKETVSNTLQNAVAKLKPTTKEAEKEREQEKAATTESHRYSYWEATRVKGNGGSQVVIGKGITFSEATARVAMGLDLMCASEAAARAVLYTNGYVNAVGPEIHGDVGYYPHYHPNRHSHTHIWFFP